MRKVLILILFCPFLTCCSSDNKDDNGYLVSIESVKSGLLGSWETTVGGKWYHNYAADGTRCDGFYPDKDWDVCGKYEMLKLGSEYFLRIYTVNSTSNDYVDRKIVTLTDSELKTVSKSDTDPSSYRKVR